MARPVRLGQELHATPALTSAPSTSGRAAPAASARRSRWLAVAGLLAVGALVRASVVLYDALSGEDATVALMAKHILHGENFPVFFYRQTYMGSLNGLHLVPALWAFGPSVLLVRLHAIAWSLLFPLGLYVLGRRAFDEATGRAALLLAAVPPFVLSYWSTVAEPHLEANTFGVVLLLLALAALTGRSAAARTRALGAFGLVAGLGCWTNVKLLVVLAPTLLLLGLGAPRLPLRRGGALLLAGLLVGSLPAWLWYLTWGDPAEGHLGSASLFLRPTLDVSRARLAGFLREVPLRLVGTYYWKPTTTLRQVALAVACVLYAAGLAVVLGRAVRASGRPAAPARRWGPWLVLLPLPVTLGATYLSPFSASFDHETSRYALPALIPLLLGVAALVVALGRRARLLGAAALGFLLAFNVWTHAAFVWPVQPRKQLVRARVIAAREAITTRLAARPPGALLVDGTFRALGWAFLLDRPVVSALVSDVYVPNAVAADAAARVAILSDRAELSAELAALGATWRVAAFDHQYLFEDVRVPARAYRMLPRGEWRVRGDPGTPAALADGDLGTGWPPAYSPLRELVVDLGSVRPIARVVLWPVVAVEDLFPLALAFSVDGVSWAPRGTVPVVPRRPLFTAGGRPSFRPRNGWLELAPGDMRARYLRIVPTAIGTPGIWGVAELLVYEAGGAATEPVATERVLGLLAARAPGRLLADPALSARVALATRGRIATLPANGTLDNHGLAPPGYLYTPVRLHDDDAALVPAEDAGDLLERLRARGVRAAAETLGSHVLFRLSAPESSSGPCRRVAWRPREVALDTDGRHARYAFEATLPESARVGAIRLEHRRVSTRNVAIVSVEAAADGGAWRSLAGARPVPEWAWGGRTLFTFSGGATEIALGDTLARRLRVALRLLYRREDPVTSLCVRARA